MSKPQTPQKTEKSGKKMMRGAALAQAIEEKAAVLRLSQKECARILGVSDPYYGLLISGQRWFGGLSSDKLEKIALFLDVPLVSVYLLGEMLKPEDFFRSSNLEDRLEVAFKHLSNDPYLSGVVPDKKSWDQSPLQMRLLCAVIYERLSEKDIMERARILNIISEKNTSSSNKKST